jgi:hypothetical protein
VAGKPVLKAALWAGLALAVVAAVAVYLLVQNVDALVKRAIERYGSDATGTAVRVADVAIALGDGRGTLRGLTVANPPGYSAQPLFALDDISVTLDPSSLAGKVAVIEELRIGATAFRYELDQGGRSNLKALQRQMKSRGESDDEPARGEERRLRIKRLVVADGEATLDLARFGVGRVTARVPGTTLTDLGGKAGLTPPELAKVVVNALARNLERSVADAGLKRLLRDQGGSPAGEALKGLLDR